MTENEQSTLRNSLARVLDHARRRHGLDIDDVNSMIADTYSSSYLTIFLGRAFRSLHQRGIEMSPAFWESTFAEEVKLWQERNKIVDDAVAIAGEATRFLYPFAVIRQEAVGHGGFHSGALGFTTPLLRWVYDCGSWRKRAVLKERIDRFLDRSRRDYGRPDIDLLFLSHFDADHVNGLETLFAGRDETHASVTTVVAPYLAPVEAFATIGRSVERGNYPPQFLQAVLNPEKYFRERGVKNLILVRPDEPPSLGPDGTDSPAPPLPPPGSSDDESDMSAKFFGGDGKPLSMLTPEFDEIGVTVADPGFFIEILRYGRSLNWIFVPHAHRWSFNRKQLARKATKTIGVPPEHGGFNAALVELLRSKQGLKAIKKIYCGLESNGTSMSLYVGPRTLGSDRQIYTRPSSEPAGWLLTGDAPLNRPDAFSQWRRAFMPIAKNTGRFMLPHHGAKGNFNSKMLSFVPKAIPFLTVDQKDFLLKKRPPRVIRTKIGKHFDPVTERREIKEVSGQPGGEDRLSKVSVW